MTTAQPAARRNKYPRRDKYPLLDWGASADRSYARRAAASGLALALLLAPALAVGQIWPGVNWQTATPAQVGMDPALLAQARTYALTGGGSGMVVRFGKRVDSWGSQHDLYELKSTTKSVGSILLGIAIGDGLMGLNVTARTYYATLGNPPSSNESTGWLPALTVRQLANHSGGFDDPGGFTALLFQPGTKWFYSNSGVNWLGDAMTLRFNNDLRTVLTNRVLTTVGVVPADLVWRDNAYRPTPLNGLARREIGSGISCSVDALGRIAYLCLRQGTWNGTFVLPSSYINSMRVPDPNIAGLPNLDPSRFPGATNHYGLMWWTNGDGTLANVPTDAYWGWGLGDSIMLVIPSLDIVATRLGGAWQGGDWTSNYSVVAPFIGPIAQSVLPTTAAAGPESENWTQVHGRYR